MTALETDIARGKIAPVYLFVGEAFGIDRVLEALRAAHSGAVESVRAEESSVAEILAVARTVPMFSARRLLLVRDCEKLKADQLAEFLPYVTEPNPSTALVFIAAKMDMRTKFVNAIKKHAVLAPFEPLKDRQAGPWVSEEARQRGLKLEPGVAQRIADAVGTNQAELSGALDRLALYCGVATVRVTDVEQLLQQTRQRSIFELTDAVGHGERRAAMGILRTMLQAREPGVQIVSMLARHLRQLWRAKELEKRSLPRADLAQAVGIHPYFLPDLIAQAAAIKPQRLARMHHALVHADRELKRSRLSDSVILDHLVLRLCPADSVSG